jgi:hypothetical protein
MIHKGVFFIKNEAKEEEKESVKEIIKEAISHGQWCRQMNEDLRG